MIRLLIDDDVVIDWKPIVNSTSQLNRIPSSVTGLIVSENSCNDLTEFDLSRFEMLKSFEVELNALRNVKNLTMNGLNELVELSIGSGSLNGVENVIIGSDSLNSISSLDFRPLSSVRRIEIGSRSLNNATSVTLDGLNSLESIVIGEQSLRKVKEYVLIE